MATGLGNKLTGQIGEHLVTAELGRRGIVATPFSGNVPDIDILAHVNGVTAHIQVKAINGAKSDAWQFDIRKFLRIDLTAKEQKVRGKAKIDRNILCIFLVLGDNLGEDEFYIFKWGWLQDYFAKTFKGRKLPAKIESFHCAIWKKEMVSHLGKWDRVTKKFKVL